MRRAPWWPVAAGGIALLEFVFAIGLWIDRLTEDRTREVGGGVTVTLPSEFGPLYGDILLTGALVLAGGAIVAGLSSRNVRPERARALLLVGLVPGVLSGAVFFWFPPFWAVTVVSIMVTVRLARRRTAEPEPV